MRKNALHKKIIKGFTLIELVVTVVIVAILGSAVLPLMQLNVKRAKESELRSDLIQIREAIDTYKKASDDGHVKKSIEQSGYPPNLQVLVDGVADEKDVNKKKMRFLRRIPADPLHIKEPDNSLDEAYEWGLRSYQSEAKYPTAGEDVYDVYSLSKETGINGIPYAQW